ncbi:PEP-CTERM sorting domain-containing protein [Microseira sp. BLCC-F43]|jgi:hypothetical protein|uniref:PEP-CTERM sorting domain-containing protein n=1 Tax=Microseira sp. BLCC-F43 TaxID=3153602 RepID=UPI0035B75D4A
MQANKIIYCLASATMLLTGLSKSASAAIIKQTFADFHGTFDSVNLPLNGGQVPTGVISASQNPNLPSIVTFDTDTNQTTFDLNFLLNFPLLTSLGLKSIPISPFETGSYIVNGQYLITDVTGQGKVSGSSPFAGINTFFQVRWIVTSPLDTSVFLGQIESEVVTICPPSSGCLQTTGTGKASIGLTSVPEPGTIPGTIVAGAIACWMKRKRKASW